MSKVLKRTFSLTEKQSAFIDAKVEAGDYASSSEVVREGLRALGERDAAIEHWLRTDVVAAYEAYKADPGSAVTADEAREILRRKRAERATAGTP